MERNNPLEEAREYILQSRELGVIDDFTSKGIADEIITISDALDMYFGISRKQRTLHATETSLSPTDIPFGGFTNKTLNELRSIYLRSIYTPASTASNPVLYESSVNNKLRVLIKKVKRPLLSIKTKLSSSDIFYLNLSSAIVSICVSHIVSSVNSYQKPYGYTPISNIDEYFVFLVFKDKEIMDILKDFDMTPECKSNYEANRNNLQQIYNHILSVSKQKNKTNGSGCLVSMLAITTLLFACICGVMMVFNT